MKYKQLDLEERYVIGALLQFGCTQAEIAECLGRSASTVSRELSRNRYPTDNHYRAYHAQSMANGRRRRSRSGSKIEPPVWKRVEQLLARDFSPEQVSGYMRRQGERPVSHETIYRRVWADKRAGGRLWTGTRGH